MIMKQAEETVSQRHQAARRWKANTGGKVIGFICCYAPEEIVSAFGMLPVRILPTPGRSPHLSTGLKSFSCPFVRGCLHGALLGEYEYLDGIVVGYACDHAAGLFHALRKRLPVSYTHLVGVPAKTDSPAAQRFFRAELGVFVRSLEDFAGQHLSPQRLREAVLTYNQNRRLLGRMYATRKNSPPPLSGAETLDVVISSMLMPKAEHNKMLEQLLDELPKRKSTPKEGLRVLVTGSENSDSQHLKVLEESGLSIVADDLCCGTRYFWTEVDLANGDPLDAIARRYLGKPSCACKSNDRRYEHLLKLAEEYRVQGVVIMHEKFCDPHKETVVRLQQRLEQAGLRNMVLEMDITAMVPGGQYKTRAEAFVEMVELAEV